MQGNAVRPRDLAVAAAVTATYLVVGAYVNLPVREALKRAVGGQVPLRARPLSGTEFSGLPG